MRETSLTSPGAIMMGHQIRRMAAVAISGVEIAARRRANGKSPAAKTLKAFFDSCSSALTTYVDSVVPTVVSRVATSATLATITMSEELANVIPATSSVTVSGGTVTGLSVSGNKLLITGTGFAAAATVAYTKPGSAPFLTDASGNALASFTGALA